MHGTQLHLQRQGCGLHHGAVELERERLAFRRSEEQVLCGLEIRVTVDCLATAGMHLEVQVGVDSVRVAGVPNEADRLAGRDLRPVLQPRRVSGAGDAFAPVVVVAREVVVQVDVVVGRPAGSVEVEHAAGRRGGRPEFDLARLGGERERSLRREDVDPLMRAARTRCAEIVDVVRGPEDREDDRLRRVTGPREGRPGQKAGDEK